MNARIAEGLLIPESNVVAADVVALLAGVNFTSAINVMLALRAIHEVKGLSYDTLLDVASMPTESAASEERRNSTSDFVYEIVDDPRSKSVAKSLKLARRFNL